MNKLGDLNLQENWQDQNCGLQDLGVESELSSEQDWDDTCSLVWDSGKEKFTVIQSWSSNKNIPVTED